MVFHEFAHGWVAYKLGDNTAKFSGRLTLNPLAHIDPFGTILLPLFLYISTHGQFVFGSAKPVPINYWALKNPRRDMMWIGASGPIANFALAFVLSLLVRFLNPYFSPLVIYLIYDLILVNVVLGVFNLIPIPPLDGSRILMGLLPQNLAGAYSQLERYGIIIVMALVAFGGFDSIISPAVKVILNLLNLSNL